MATTLQKEYALLYYIQTKLGQKDNNGFLHDLYTPKNLHSIIEELVRRNTKDQPTVNVSSAVEQIMSKVNVDKLIAPNMQSDKTKLLPYDTLSFMQICMKKTIDKTILNMKQRLFIDDITEAKEGLAAYFVSTFTIRYMTSPSFIHLVKMDKRPSVDEIADELHQRYPDSPLFQDAKSMSDIEEKIAPLVAPLTKNQFTYDDLDSLFKALDNFPGVLDETSLTNSIDDVIANKQKAGPRPSFNKVRNNHEADVKASIKDSHHIDEFFNAATKSRFVGTIKFKRNGTIDGTSRANVVEVALRKEDRTFDTFVQTINQLLELEGVPEVTTGYYKEKHKVILTEEQYHVLFPEYFVSIGAIKEKVSTDSEMGGSTMKSGDEKTSIIDSYTGEEDDDDSDNDNEEEFDNSTGLTLGKTKKLMLAKMLATINGHPDTVPDKLEPTMGRKAMIYNLNRILIAELFNTSYRNIEGLAIYIGTGNVPSTCPYLIAHEKELRKLKDLYIKEMQDEHAAFKERDIHAKSYANILSALARLASMDPDHEADRRQAISGNPQFSHMLKNDITLTIGGYTYALNPIHLTTIVNRMIQHTMKGEFISTITLDDGADPVYGALYCLKRIGLLRENNKVYRLITDMNAAQRIIDSRKWEFIGTIHDKEFLSPALRNCSYILKHNGWEPMSNSELGSAKFVRIVDRADKHKPVDDLHNLGSVMENLQGKIKPYMLNLQAVNRIIEIIRRQYHITSLNPVEAPVVDADTLAIADNRLHSFSVEDSMEAFDNFSQGFYMSHIAEQYNEEINDACENIKKTLTENHLFNEGTRDTLLSKVNNTGRPAAIINDIFGEKKRDDSSYLAEDFNRIQMRNIFTIAQEIIILYNNALQAVSVKSPPVASNFRKRGYITADDLNKMKKGISPSGKVYKENGAACPNDFIPNAYLIDVLFEAIYLLTINFDLQTQKTYTTQDVLDMTNVSEMKDYISIISRLNVKSNPAISKSLSTIRDSARLDLLFKIPFLNLVTLVIELHPDITQLTVGMYNRINGSTTHENVERMMKNLDTEKTNTFDIRNRTNSKKDTFNKFLRPCDYDEYD